MSERGKFRDKLIACEVCGTEFSISAGEQAFYEEKGLSKPKRCQACTYVRTRKEKEVSNFEDQTRTCVDCEQEFTWTAGEQEFFHEKGFSDPPKRCKECRQAKKAARGETRGNRSGNRY